MQVYSNGAGTPLAKRPKAMWDRIYFGALENSRGSGSEKTAVLETAYDVNLRNL